jgi:hypothetical protein
VVPYVIDETVRRSLPHLVPTSPSEGFPACVRAREGGAPSIPKIHRNVLFCRDNRAEWNATHIRQVLIEQVGTLPISESGGQKPVWWVSPLTPPRRDKNLPISALTHILG